MSDLNLTPAATTVPDLLPASSAADVVLSESEQMYLLTIARLVEAEQPEPVPLAILAETLAILAVSANQMVHKLANAGLLTYRPYHGVELTQTGWHIARRVLRCRRLWEVFLVERLGLGATEADALACRLEHLTDTGVAARLARYLGFPAVSPQGRPIPPSDGGAIELVGLPLTVLPVGGWGRVVGLSAEPVGSAYLERAGLSVGAVVHVQAAGAAGALLVEVASRVVQVADDLAAAILVEPARSVAVALDRRTPV